MIKVVPVNETSIKLVTDDFGIEQEISEFFTFEVPGAKYTPMYKKGIWDGKIRVFDSRKKLLPKGLLGVLVQFFADRDCEFEVDASLDNSTSVEFDDVKAFIDSLNLSARGVPLTVRDYQYDAVHQALSKKRCILLSPTSSGKSMMIYSKIRYHIDKLQQKIILIVPSTQLVEQMYSDFKDYSTNNGWDTEENCQLLYSGKEKEFTSNVMISTWQSLHAMKKNLPKMFNDIVNRTDVLIFDEAHSLQGSSVGELVNSFVHTEHRTGTTGTLDESKTHKLVLVGMMGTPYQVTTTRALMDTGQVANLKIKSLVLEYPPETRKAMKGMTYPDEIQFLIGSTARNKFIANLAKACTGNTLILCNFVETHSAVLYDIIKSIVPPERQVHLISGGVAVKERERVRKLVEDHDDAIIIATSSLFSTGTNIPSLENIIFGISSKSTIRVRQSIGRGLRLKAGKEYCTLFDISDNLSIKSHKNHTMKHFEERIKIYDKEQFEYTVMRLPIKM